MIVRAGLVIQQLLPLGTLDLLLASQAAIKVPLHPLLATCLIVHGRRSSFGLLRPIIWAKLPAVDFTSRTTPSLWRITSLNEERVAGRGSWWVL